MDSEAVLSRLAELRETGLAIGLSLSGPAQSETLLKAMSVEFDGRPLFSAVQATWNLLAQEAGDSLSQAHDAGMGIIVKEALANGRLTSRNRDPAFVNRRMMLEESARSLDTTIDALALAAVLAQPWVDVVLSGAANIEHMMSNVQALNVKRGEWLDHLLVSLREKPEAYWRIRSGLNWNEGKLPGTAWPDQVTTVLPRFAGPLPLALHRSLHFFPLKDFWPLSDSVLQVLRPA